MSTSSSSGTPLPPIPVCCCCCDCYEGAGGETPTEAGVQGGTGSTSCDMGAPELGQTGSGGYNSGFGNSLEYSNLGFGSSGAFGNGWSNHDLPTLIGDGNDVIIESGSSQIVRYIKVGDSYVPTYFVRDVLTFDSGTNVYTLTQPDGSSMRFSGDTGKLLAKFDPFGNETTFYFSGDELTTVVIGSGSAAVSYHYTWTTLGRLESIVLRVGDPNSSASDVRQITYDYTTEGNLELVTLNQKHGGTWQEIETAYYRYYPESAGLLQFILGNTAYKQIKSVDASWPEAADETTLKEYADREFSYGQHRAVSSVKTHGGKYEYSFRYEWSSHSTSDANVWMKRTVVTQPDGTTHTYYYNWSSSLLLKEVRDGAQAWYPICQQFDANSRVILKADSSAIESVQLSDPHLFTLKANSGQNRVIQYDEHGNVVLIGLKKGAGSTVPLVKLEERTYYEHVVNGVSVWHLASKTIYRDATDTGATNPVTTTFAYEWHQVSGQDTFQLKKRTTTLPAVPNSENGANATATIEEHYDTYGFLTKRVDPMGVATTYEYDLQKGAIKKEIQDAGTGRLNLTTDYEADALGRTIRQLGPEHEIAIAGTATAIRRAEWTQYLDAEDEVRTISGYLKVSDSSEVMVNPVRIERHDQVDPQGTGRRMNESIAAVYSGAGIPPATSTFARPSWVRWSTQHYDHHNELIHSRLYHLIPTSGPGAIDTNYAQTMYGYDSAGRQNQVTSPKGTVTRMTFNAMGWQLETQVNAILFTPVTTRVNEYDGGVSGGNGNLTKVTLPVDDDSSHDRVTIQRFDWRNRPFEIESNDGVRTLIRRSAFDNRDNTIRVDEYQNSVAIGNMINRAEAFFDGRNLQYRSKRYAVSGGSFGVALTSESYFDQSGRLVRAQPAGKVGFTVTHYDAVSRVTATFLGFGGTLDYSDFGKISDVTVQEQAEMEYDAAGNAIATTNRQRFDNATGTGELEDPENQPKARVSYDASYPDALGRMQIAANYGTHGGDPWSRPDNPPSPSNDILVSSFGYDAAGDQVEMVDPMGTVNKREYDQAGRMVKTIENFVASGSGNDKNKTTRFEYNSDGNLRKLIAENFVTGEQVTEWTYGIAQSQGSEFSSNGVVYQKIYPDSTGTSDRVTYRYNRQGQVIGMTDQAGTIHAYAYDRFGRITEDAVTNFGAGIDQTVERIARSYEARGMLEKVTSYGASSVVRNEVQFAYNGFSQLEKDYQAHSGAVNTGSTLYVGYSYANGSANTVRRTGVTYPNAATISIAYEGTAADALSRPDAIKEGSTTLCSYRYLGSGTVIGVKYDAASNVELTYENGGSGGDGGDQYTGLDRFGRLVETIWKNSTVKEQSQYGRNRFGGVTWRRDAEAHNQSVSTEDNFYWYDGLFQVQENQRGDLAGTAPNYTGITNPQKAYEWEYDPTGNWLTTSVTAESDGFVLVGAVADVTSTGLAFGHLIGTPPVAVNDTIEVNGTPFTVTSVTINSPQNPATQDGYYEIEVTESTSGINVDDPITAEGETVLPQQRQHNAANEITYVWPPGSTNPTYDPVGNMTLVPPILGVQSAPKTFQWDAWNRLVKVNDGEADEVSYAYDGLFRRTTKTNASETRHYYYNDQWRAVEERVAGAGFTVDRQYVWGLRDRWDLLRRQRSTGGSSLSETHYCLRDYLDPVAIIGTDGLVKERYAYDAFGNVRFLAPDYTSRSSSDFDWDWLFHGEFRDTDTGLYNYGYRYYSSGLGRWVSRDPVGESEGANQYIFVYNFANRNRDIFGLSLSFQSSSASFDVSLVFANVKEGVASTKRPEWDYDVKIEHVSGDCNCFLTVQGEVPKHLVRIDIIDHVRFGVNILNTLRHELTHVKINKDAWNRFAGFANGKEGHYCPCECADIAESIIYAFADECMLGAALEHYEFDLVEYGFHFGGETEVGLKEKTIVVGAQIKQKQAEIKRLNEDLRICLER